ncbi:hypothetical protein ACFL0V_05265 [Nanoarchaeota archaeon]
MSEESYTGILNYQACPELFDRVSRVLMLMGKFATPLPLRDGSDTGASIVPYDTISNAVHVANSALSHLQQRSSKEHLSDMTGSYGILQLLDSGKAQEALTDLSDVIWGSNYEVDRLQGYLSQWRTATVVLNAYTDLARFKPRARSEEWPGVMAESARKINYEACADLFIRYHEILNACKEPVVLPLRGDGYERSESARDFDALSSAVHFAHSALNHLFEASNLEILGVQVGPEWVRYIREGGAEGALKSTGSVLWGPGYEDKMFDRGEPTQCFIGGVPLADLISLYALVEDHKASLRREPESESEPDPELKTVPLPKRGGTNPGIGLLRDFD